MALANLIGVGGVFALSGMLVRAAQPRIPPTLLIDLKAALSYDLPSWEETS